MSKLPERDVRFEPVDSRPMALPVGYNRPPTLSETVAKLVKGALSQRAAMEGRETFEEANDFDIDDDPALPETPAEINAEAADFERHLTERSIKQKRDKAWKAANKVQSAEDEVPVDKKSKNKAIKKVVNKEDSDSEGDSEE